MAVISAEKKKRHPESNFHCFEGAGRALSLAAASGHGGAHLENGRDGYRVVFDREADGSIVNNGGLFNPKEELIEPNFRLFRFFSSGNFRAFGRAGWLGNWFVTIQAISDISAASSRSGTEPHIVANNYLATSEKNNDCKYIAELRAKTFLGAWRGKGKPFRESGSFDRLDLRGDATLHSPPPGIKFQQLFVPGVATHKIDDTPRFARYFELVNVYETKDIARIL